MASAHDIVETWNMLHANYSYHARQLSEQYGAEKAQDMLDKLLSGIWLPILADVPSDILKAAALQYVARGNIYFPQVGELREIAFDLIDVTEGRDSTPYDGWSQIMRAMRIREPIHDEMAKNALEAIGGMRVVRFSPETSLPILMSQFIKAYRTLQGRIRDSQRMLPDVRQLVERMSMENLLARVEHKELQAGQTQDETEWNG